MAVRQWQTAFWSLCHPKHCMMPSASWYYEGNWRRTWAKWGHSKTKCLSSPNALVLHKVQRRRCRGTAGLASLPCSTAWQAKHETPCGTASAAAAWKWALEAQSKAQCAADWGAETMQSTCRALPFWRGLFLGTHTTATCTHGFCGVGSPIFQMQLLNLIQQLPISLSCITPVARNSLRSFGLVAGLHMLCWA